MAPYTLNPSSFQPNQVGQLYHVGLSDGAGHSYGYSFWNDGHQSQGMQEKSNIADKDKLIQYGSTNLIDRDFAYYPRVTQGDYSGGALQTVALDMTKFMDSDLDINTPGYLQLRSSWLRKTVAIGALGGAMSQSGVNQCIGFGNDIYFSFGENSGNVYRLQVRSNIAPQFNAPAASAVMGLFTDGNALFAGTSGGLYFSNGDLTMPWGTIATSLNGAAVKWWEVEQGTNGRFAYYTVGSPGNASTLYKIDINAGRPVAPANQPQVPTGSAAVYIADIVGYQSGIAILTVDTTAFNGFDVWYHDGQNMTRIVRVEGYQAFGMCSCLGNLYVGAADIQTSGGPVLIQISSGGYQVVVRPGIPNTNTSWQRCGQPRSSAEYVYWPVMLQGTPLGLTFGGLPTLRILAYNTLTNASGYLPNMDNGDFGGSFGNSAGYIDVQAHRMLTTVGSAVAIAYQSNTSGQGVCQYQYNASIQPGKYQASGWMVSSKMDFGTPGIPKRFRRIEINHAPLRAGESITVKAFVDQDPLQFTPSLAPVPGTASVTDNFQTATVTLLPLGQDTVGRSLYYAMQLNSGSGQTTTPRVIWAAVEVGGTWNWDFVFDCSSRRRTLTQQPDGQGATGKDLYWLIRNSYENGNNLTLYLATGLTYTVNVESLEAQALGYTSHSLESVKADEEWKVHAVLRQVL